MVYGRDYIFKQLQAEHCKKRLSRKLNYQARSLCLIHQNSLLIWQLIKISVWGIAKSWSSLAFVNILLVRWKKSKIHRVIENEIPVNRMPWYTIMNSYNLTNWWDFLYIINKYIYASLSVLCFKFNSKIIISIHNYVKLLRVVQATGPCRVNI